MRVDGTFIGVEVDDAVVGDSAIAAKLREVCPVDIYTDKSGKVDVVDRNVDECVLCRLCMDATPAGAVKVIKLYDNEAVLA
jgi:NAD-dependent dihydropyrimidine dehydrogenase PreA subunit